MTKFVLSSGAFFTFARGQSVSPPVLVELSIRKIDDVWREVGFFDYVHRFGVGGKPEKYAGVKDWLDVHDEIHAPILELFLHDKKFLKFENGRHTFAYFRDAEADSMMFAVPEDAKEFFLQEFGVD